VKTGLRIYNNPTNATFDPAKRDETLAARGLDFLMLLACSPGSRGRSKIFARIMAKRASRRASKTDFQRGDAHVVKDGEYDELPELTAEMLGRGVVKRGGRPISPNPRKLISLRLPADVIARWRATGPGWQTRMAERLRKVR
jgi:uncharacterized protein (DUF4415 family)